MYIVGCEIENDAYVVIVITLKNSYVEDWYYMDQNQGFISENNHKY